MLEVHPPHKALANVKEFVVHILTITVGLLIAVGIERIVEWRHHVHLVAEAREKLRMEIESNVKVLDAAVVSIVKRQKEIGDNLTLLSAIISSKKDFDASNGSLTANFSGVRVDDTTWRTVQQTGVLSYMPYEDAHTYSEIYAAQERFRAHQDVLTEDFARVLGLMSKFNLAKEDRLSSEQAASLAEQYGIWSGHLSLWHLLARAAAANERAFLEGRPPPAGLSENWTTQ